MRLKVTSAMLVPIGHKITFTEVLSNYFPNLLTLTLNGNGGMSFGSSWKLNNLSDIEI